MILLMCLINLIGFILCYVDKQCAIHQKSRIPEAIFFFLGFIGGAFFILMGMHLFHHKTKKNSFKTVIYFDAVISLILYYELFTCYIG